jgi:hypothetical protein
MSIAFLTSLRTINQLMAAGIAVTAFALLLYALTFNLRDRVARSFAMILACVTVVFTGEAIGSTSATAAEIQFWLRLQWVGIALLPVAYFHASDALLASTGKPSRGRRRVVVRLLYLVSLAFLATLPFDLLVGPLVMGEAPAPYLMLTWLSMLFTVYYGAVMFWSWVNFWRAFRRTLTSTGKRRLIYLMAGATAPALGSYPYLVIGHSLAAAYPGLFWVLALISNLMVTALLVLMAYAISFFGVAWPDRVIRIRLFKWLMRGPVTASTVLAVTTLVRRAGEFFGFPYTAAVPISMVSTVLTMQYLITLTSPFWERLILQSGEHGDLKAFQELENRLLTTGDLRQFLEATLAAFCDRLQSPAAFLVAFGPNGSDLVVTVGDRQRLQEPFISDDLLQVVAQKSIVRHEEDVDSGRAALSHDDDRQDFFVWGNYWLVPLFGELNGERQLLGLIGVLHGSDLMLMKEQNPELDTLSTRAAMALRDRSIQRQIFTSLSDLAPNVDMIQRLRAAARYDSTGLLTPVDIPFEQEQVTRWIKDALTHYWGGPKLTESPLLGLQIVQRMVEGGENPANALRTTLRQAIEQVRPQGERRFTAEWILYNILEMKFLEGRKVREVALRLAMSEADFYRKQRIAIEEVSKVIVEMEQQAMVEERVASYQNQPIYPNEV